MSIVLTSCCDCRKLSKLQKPLLGTTWQLVQIMGRDVKAEGDSYTLLFNEVHSRYTATSSAIRPSRWDVHG